MVAPLVASAGISAAGSLLGGLFGSGGAAKAAKIQRQTAREQIAAANQNRNYQYALNAPTISAGDNANKLFSGFLGVGIDPTPDYGAYASANPDVAAEYQRIQGSGQFASLDDFAKYHYDTYGRGEGRNLPTTGGTTGDAGSAAALDAFRSSTGYQDLVKEGLAAVNSNAYARGMGDSGATLKALQDRGTSLADRSAQGWLGNLNTLMNLGGQARGLVAGIGTQTVGMNNQASQGAADASSNASLINGQNWSQALQNIGNSAAYAYGSSYGGGSGSGFGAAPVYTTPPYAGLRG